MQICRSLYLFPSHSVSLPGAYIPKFKYEYNNNFLSLIFSRIWLMINTKATQSCKIICKIHSSFRGNKFFAEKWFHRLKLCLHFSLKVNTNNFSCCCCCYCCFVCYCFAFVLIICVCFFSVLFVLVWLYSNCTCNGIIHFIWILSVVDTELKSNEFFRYLHTQIID